MDPNRLPVLLRGLLCCFVLAGALVSVRGNGRTFPYLMMISNRPVLGRHSDLYIYAVFDEGSDGDSVEFTKEGGLPSSIVETGELDIPGPGGYIGCWMKVGEANRLGGLRFGRYEATYTFATPFSGTVEMMEGEVLVRPHTKLLDTRGDFTVTIYPAMDTGTALDGRVSIGVRRYPGCRKIIWCKGKKRNLHTGARLALTSTEDAGLYTITRPGRGKRGWSVQISVIASPCPRGHYSPDGGETCTGGKTCKNGGVLMPYHDECTCPVLYQHFSDDCSCTPHYEGFMIAYNGPSSYLCGDLPGGHPKCKGYRMNLGDNYGSTCFPGWWGSSCDKPCPKGTYGPDCSQPCPPEESDCDRFFGPESIFCDD